MNCLYHDKEVIAISLDELNENNSRLLCVECLLEDKHFDKMKWTDFQMKLSRIIEEVEYEKLESAFNMQEQMEYWESLIQSTIQYLQLGLEQLRDYSLKKLFHIQTDLLQNDVLSRLINLLQNEEDDDEKAIELGIKLLKFEGQMNDKVEEMHIKKNWILGLQEKVQDELRIFLNKCQDSINDMCCPIEFDQFKYFINKQIVFDHTENTKQEGIEVINDKILGSIGTRGEIVLWRLPDYEYMCRLTTKHEEQAFQLKGMGSNYLIAGTVDQWKHDSIIIWGLYDSYPVLVYQELVYHLNQLEVVGNGIITCDFKDQICYYEVNKLEQSLEMVNKKIIKLSELRKKHHSQYIVGIKCKQDLLVIQLVSEIIIMKNLEIVDIIVESGEICKMNLSDDLHVIYFTKKGDLKDYSLQQRKRIGDYGCSYEKIDSLEMISDQVVGYIANEMSIIIQRLNDGLFIKIRTGILYPLRDLKMSNKEILTVDLSGRIQVWGLINL